MVVRLCAMRPLGCRPLRAAVTRPSRPAGQRARGVHRVVAQEIDTDSIRVPKVPANPPSANPNQRGLVKQPEYPPPRGGRPPSSMPPSRRKLIASGAALVVAALAIKGITAGTVTPVRQAVVNRAMLQGVELRANQRWQGDVMLIGEQGMYYIGEDGIRVDAREDVWVEKTDKDGNLIDLTYLGNLNDGSFDFLDDYDSNGRPLRR